MAHMLVETDPLVPGRWTLRCNNPSALAATCDALVQVLDLGGEALAGWALHNDEQAGMRDAAYIDELQELGPMAAAQVVELTRPWQPNVVWVDRYHLLIASAAPPMGSRLLGLYVGSPGRIVLSVHQPSMAAQVQAAIAALPESSGRGWDDPAHVALTRFVLRYDPEEPGAVKVRAPQPSALAVQDAITRLTQHVAAW